MKRLRNFLIVLIVLLLGISIFSSKKREYANTVNGWNLILVNDDYYVPKNYSVDLIELDNGERVDKRIYPELQEMFDAARKEEVYMTIVEGYRTSEEQQKMLHDKRKQYEEKVLIPFVAEYMAEKWVATPGTSEHELGLAVDINANTRYSTGTQVYDWLAEHAHEYGFVQRYPEEKTEITGIRYEPWHYRYVGKECAKEMHDKFLCLEEYLDEM